MPQKNIQLQNKPARSKSRMRARALRRTSREYRERNWATIRSEECNRIQPPEARPTRPERPRAAESVNRMKKSDRLLQLVRKSAARERVEK